MAATSNLSIGSGLIVSFSWWAHLTTSALFRTRAPGPVSGQLSTTISWRGRSSCRGFLSPFSGRHSLLGHPVPAKELGSPHGRLTGQGRTQTGRGQRCSPWSGVAHRPASVASQRLSLRPAPASHLRGTPHHEASTRVHTISPVRSSPRLWLPDETGALGLEPRASHPALTSDARRSGDRQVIEHGPESTLYVTIDSSLQSCVDLSMRATSRRTRPSSSEDRPVQVDLGGCFHAVAITRFPWASELTCGWSLSIGRPSRTPW